MSYPQGAPGGPGFPPAQQPTTQFAAPTQQMRAIPEANSTVGGPSKLPAYLSLATAVLGVLVYLASFGPKLTLTDAPVDVSLSPVRFDFALIAAVLAGLVAGFGLLPKQTPRPAVVAALAVLGFLVAISTLFSGFEGTSVGWGVYLVIAFTLIQAAVAVVALLFDAEILTPPVPRPKYEQQNYGQYPGGYYGQQQSHGGPQHHQGPQQRPGYPTPYGGYSGSGQTTGGFPAAGQNTGGYGGESPSGPPTPPTGFPTYGQPPSSNTPTSQVPTQQQPPSSPQSGQSSS